MRLFCNSTLLQRLSQYFGGRIEKADSSFGLNGGEVFQDECLVSQYTIPSYALRTIVSYCDTYNLPYFIDDTFNYAIQNPNQIPFLSNVDPLNKASILPVQELNKPIKAVIPLAEHEDIREDLIF